MTGDDLFAQVLMLRTADQRTILLMEGPTDCQALDPHVDEDHAQTLPGHSKSTVEAAIKLVNGATVERVLAILDLDWVGMIDDPLDEGNVVYTDEYDLDATILLAADVMARIISSTTDRDRVQAHRELTGIETRDAVIRLAGTIGVGRYLSDRDGLGIQLRGFPIHVALSTDGADVDVAQLATVALGRSGAPSMGHTDFVVALRAELASTDSLERFCSGHHLAAALATLIRQKWGGGSVGRDMIEQFGRAAFSCASLQGTALYAQVAQWATESATQVWNCTPAA